MAVRYAEMLGLPVALMHKRRTSFTEAQTMSVVGDLKDKIPIVIDDVISNGTVLTQVPLLLEAGARPEVYLAITHGVLEPRALQLLEQPAVCRLFITNTIPLPPESNTPSFKWYLSRRCWRPSSNASTTADHQQLYPTHLVARRTGTADGC
jgi:ribose-phosphate pyrophosphokinase